LEFGRKRAALAANEYSQAIHRFIAKVPFKASLWDRPGTQIIAYTRTESAFQRTRKMSRAFSANATEIPMSYGAALRLMVNARLGR
jgi:hypothetical protein